MKKLCCGIGEATWSGKVQFCGKEFNYPSGTEIYHCTICQIKTLKAEVERLNSLVNNSRVRVVVESPYAGDVEANVKYARQCISYCLRNGLAPYASHLLYTQDGVLDDSVPEERALCINAGFAWKHASGCKTLFFIDLGWSDGMIKTLEYCKENDLDYQIFSISKLIDGGNEIEQSKNIFK